MKKNNCIKKGYTLAELLVTISLLIIVTGLAIPVVKKALPDGDKEKVKYAYQQIGFVIRSMVTDPNLYPFGHFDNPKDYNNPQTGVEYKKEEKFTNAFISKLNVLKVKKLQPNEEWNPSAEKNASWKKTLRVNNEDEAKPISSESISNKNRKCILTNNKIYYCLPEVTYQNYTIDESWSEAKKKQERINHDRLAEEGAIIISVYLDENHSIDKGYYFLVNGSGKISLLPDDVATCFGKSSCKTKLDPDNPNDYDENGNPKYEVAGNCANPEIYKKFNHCKTYEFLSHTK